MRQMLDFTHANLVHTDFSQPKNSRPKDQLMDGFICANMVHTEYNRWSTPEREFCGDNSSFFNFFKNFQ